MSDDPKRFDSVIEMLTHDCHKYALENARLKAEVERLTQNTDKLCRHGDLEIARLNAQVEAYRSASDEVAAAFLALPTPHNQVARVCEGIESLKAEVERLTERLNRHLEINDELDARCTRLRKAGDAMAETLEGAGFDSAMDFWNAAKEGKPQ